MSKDTRDRNIYFDRNDIGRYLKQYTGALSYGLTKVSEDDLKKAQHVLRVVLASGGRIFVGGNGGSAAISDHLCCDFVKGTYSDKINALSVHSLVGSQALFTAIGNDIGYEHTFSHQLKMANINSKDAVILISSSGNSANILEAARLAHLRCSHVIGLTGFTGGGLFEMADIKLHVPVHNYGIVEDVHQAIMHVLAQFHWLSFHG